MGERCVVVADVITLERQKRHPHGDRERCECGIQFRIAKRVTVHEFVLQAQVPSPKPSEKSKSCPPWQLLVAENRREPADVYKYSND